MTDERYEECLDCLEESGQQIHKLKARHAELERAVEIRTEHNKSLRRDNDDKMQRLVDQEAEMETLQAEVERLRAECRWIPVTKQKPDKIADYLGFFGPAFGQEVVEWCDGEWLDCEDNEVFPTHWQPLPAAPEEGKDD